MSYGVRYTGRFWSVRGGDRYDIEILEDGYTGDPEEVTLTADPLVIEWQEEDLIEPVLSGAATLELLSDSDRRFVDLYTIDVGRIRLDVYLNGSIYWSGALDPELYEEPYSYESGYAVSLTFSDFAILDRLSYDRSGFITLGGIIEACAGLACLNYGSIVERISTGTTITTSGDITSAVSFLSDNFYDEDGEAYTWREVLDETLKVFSLRMRQRDGNIYVYDLNAMAGETPMAVSWLGTDATYSVDKVYNNVSVKFSPYHHNDMLDDSVDYDSVTGGSEYTVRVEQATGSLTGFTVRVTGTGEGMDINADDDLPPKYFAVSPVYSGEEEAGVAYTIKIDHTGNSGDNYTSYVNEAIADMPDSGVMMIRGTSMPYLSWSSSIVGYKLRVRAYMMADVRYNPYEDDNETGDQERMKNWCNFAYVPFRLILRDDDGNALYHYENKGVKAQSGDGAYSHTPAKWVSGEGEWGDAYLAYYSVTDRKSDTGLMDWAYNKQCIGYYRDTLPSIFEKRDDGEFIDIPAYSGRLDLQIGKGLMTYDYKSSTEWQTKDDIYWRIRWLLFKSIGITVVDKNNQEIDEEDVELKAWVNEGAKDSLDIDTIVGCLESPSPSAVGQIFATDGHGVISKFYRAGVGDRIEKLMIGSIYTRYASRHLVLYGTAAVIHDFGIFTDANEPYGFEPLSEKQDLRAGTSYIKMAAFDADSYEGIEYEE